MYMNMLLAGTIGNQLNSAFSGLDMAVFQFFGSIQNDFLTFLAKAFTAMASTKFVILLFVMGLVMCFFKRTRKVGFAIVAAVAIGTIITNFIVKPIVMRDRPYNTLQTIENYWNWYLGAGSLCEPDYCFPSGHTTGAFEIAISLFLVLTSAKKKKVAWIFPVVAVLIGASRVYLMVHYITDVIAGMLVGIIAGILGYLISCGITKFVQKRKIDDIVDLERLFKRGIKKKAAAIVITVYVVICYVFAFVTFLDEGGPDTQRCEYDREYKCMNEAQIGSKKYPPIKGKNYCKIHWKQLNEEFEANGTIK